jgi:dipeptidase D
MASALLYIDDSALRETTEEVKRLRNIIKTEYSVSEPDFEITLERSSRGKETILLEKSLISALAAIFSLPCGVLSFSQYLPGIPESSCNIGTVDIKSGKSIISLMARYNTNSRADWIASWVKYLGGTMGASVEISGSYPAWEFSASSELRDIYATQYTKRFGKPPKIASIHAGVECALMMLKKPGMDMISFGPDIVGAHTTEERAVIPSMIRTWELLCDILGAMKQP